ncbi:GNAT family protein [Bacillus sonorensis]|uniref:Acetyltransferase YdaF n=2 Tax=Bacillus sonorensis TaxID=119858 RepID=M5P3M9_9BACI|nr:MULTISPECIES: GNAT family protein [Bacillus]TWK75266.1 putative ribosomal N-acetyltransferase YdaF [Bacillus paralicheniformis]ASB90974.1 Putative ribosomal N-acetyltransferase YdaF [Bacillus sonorensis]EME74053.1 acetyltransferase YdaF [Bacillus sonorensis L12]MBG9913502.1 alanine acetyltransferase [Bacillus sonorensis]MCF7619780.1 GNAT family N-acetyltransferase [Bacillus sonorensis]
MFTLTINDDLYLKMLEPKDARDVYMMVQQSKRHLRKWLFWVDGTKKLEDSEAFIEESMKQTAANNGFQAGIWYQNEFAGIIGLHYVNWINRTTSLGYWLGEPFQGKGIMTEACRALIDMLFNDYELNRIEIRAATKNMKSQAIPERLGFTKEGRLRQCEWLHDHFADHFVYGLLREDYQNMI